MKEQSMTNPGYKLLALFCFVLLQCNVFAQEGETLLSIAHRNYELGDYKEAIKYLNKAVKEDAKNPEVFYLLGVCKSNVQLNEEAINDYNIALVLDPDFAEVYFEKGYSLFMVGRLEESVLNYDKNIELKPKNAIAFVNRGSVKCILGDKEGAMADWKRAEELGAPIPEQECED